MERRIAEAMAIESRMLKDIRRKGHSTRAGMQFRSYVWNMAALPPGVDNLVLSRIDSFQTRHSIIPSIETKCLILRRVKCLFRTGPRKRASVRVVLR